MLTPLPVVSLTTRRVGVDLWHLDHFGIRRAFTIWCPVTVRGLILTGRQLCIEWRMWTLIVAWR